MQTKGWGKVWPLETPGRNFSTVFQEPRAFSRLDHPFLKRLARKRAKRMGGGGCKESAQKRLVNGPPFHRDSGPRQIEQPVPTWRPSVSIHEGGSHWASLRGAHPAAGILWAEATWQPSPAQLRTAGKGKARLSSLAHAQQQPPLLSRPLSGVNGSLKEQATGAPSFLPTSELALGGASSALPHNPPQPQVTPPPNLQFPARCCPPAAPPERGASSSAAGSSSKKVAGRSGRLRLRVAVASAGQAAASAMASWVASSSRWQSTQRSQPKAVSSASVAISCQKGESPSGCITGTWLLVLFILDFTGAGATEDGGDCGKRAIPSGEKAVGREAGQGAIYGVVGLDWDSGSRPQLDAAVGVIGGGPPILIGQRWPL